MGLLYVNGERYHDDDAELIERLRRAERRSRFIGLIDGAESGENFADMFDDGEGKSLLSQVRAAARARRDDIPH